MNQRTRKTAQQHNSTPPVSRGSLPRPAASGLFRHETSQLSGTVCREGFTRTCVARLCGLIRSGSSGLRVVRSSAYEATALRRWSDVGVRMT